MRVHPGKAHVYERVCREFMPRMQAANPGILFYELIRSRDEPDTYRVIEAYADQAAMDRHTANPDLHASFGALQECIAELDIRLHDRVDQANSPA